MLKSCHILDICRTKKSLWYTVSDNSYSALAELNPDYRVQNDEPAENQHLSSEDEKEVKRGIGAIFSSVLPGLITLAAESLTSWIKGKQQRRIHQAVDTMRKTESEVKNTLSQYLESIV